MCSACVSANVLCTLSLVYSILARRQAQSIRSLYYEQVGLVNSQLDISRGTGSAVQRTTRHPALFSCQSNTACSTLDGACFCAAVTTVCTMLDVPRKQLMLVSTRKQTSACLSIITALIACCYAPLCSGVSRVANCVR